MIRSIIEHAFGGRNGSRDAESLIERAGWREGNGASVPLVDPVDRLMAELDRARRYERPLTIAVLSAAPSGDGPRSVGNGEEALHVHGNGRRRATVETELPQVVSLLAAAALQEVLRGSDVVCYQHASNRFVLALAEAGRHNAQRALGRIQSLFRDVLRLDVQAGFARFPDEGLTLEDLVATAVARVPGVRTPFERPADPPLQFRAPALTEPTAQGE